jgi:hypothetical protein
MNKSSPVSETILNNERFRQDFSRTEGRKYMDLARGKSFHNRHFLATQTCCKGLGSEAVTDMVRREEPKRGKITQPVSRPLLFWYKKSIIQIENILH